MAKKHGDNVNVKLVILFIVAAVASFFLYLYLTSPATFTALTTQLSTKAQGIIQNVAGVWSGLPDLAKTAITLGIPTLFTAFFAWTKTRAMNQLQQVQVQAKEQITQMQGENAESQQLVTAQAAQINRLEGQLQNQPDTTALINQLADKDTLIRNLEKEREALIKERDTYQQLDQKVVKAIEEQRRVK